MKYVVVDERKHGLFTTECATRDEALETAQREWEQLSDHDEKQVVSFYVLESVNPDETSENHFDGNIVKEYK